MRLLLVLAVSSLFAIAIPLQAQHDGCPHAGATIQALRGCVEHAADEQHIDNAGVVQSLLAKLDAAQAAVNRGQTHVAVDILEAFIRQLRALSDVHIAAMHAEHMIAHAESVIEVLLL